MVCTIGKKVSELVFHTLLLLLVMLELIKYELYRGD